MKNAHSLISFLIAGIFFAILYLFSSDGAILRGLFFFYGLFVLAASWYNRRYLLKIGKYDLWQVVRFALLLSSAFAVFFVLHSSFARMMFLIVSFFVVWFFEYALGNFSENLLFNETLLSAFGFFVFLAATRFYYSFSGWLTTALGFGFCILLGRAFFEICPKNNSVKWLTTLVLALLVSEIYWATSFLPPHFSVLGFLAFNVFFLGLVFNYFYFFQSLNYKKVQFYLTIFAFSTALLFLVTPWQYKT